MSLPIKCEFQDKCNFFNQITGYCNPDKCIIVQMLKDIQELKHVLTKDGRSTFRKDYSNEFIIPNNEGYLIYILKLENNKWYIGKTRSLEYRLEKHKKGQASSWTQRNRVIAVEEIIENGNEKEITLDYMRKYGWENVRRT